MGAGALESDPVTPLSPFGLFAVTAMLVCSGLEKRSHWFILAFAASCLMGSIYGFLQGAWPFGIVEFVWSLVALRRWWIEKTSSPLDRSRRSLSGPPV